MFETHIVFSNKRKFLSAFSKHTFSMAMSCARQLSKNTYPTNKLFLAYFVNHLLNTNIFSEMLENTSPTNNVVLVVEWCLKNTVTMKKSFVLCFRLKQIFFTTVTQFIWHRFRKNTFSTKHHVFAKHIKTYLNIKVDTYKWNANISQHGIPTNKDDQWYVIWHHHWYLWWDLEPPNNTLICQKNCRPKSI